MHPMKRYSMGSLFWLWTRNIALSGTPAVSSGVRWASGKVSEAPEK